MKQCQSKPQPQDLDQQRTALASGDPALVRIANDDDLGLLLAQTTRQQTGPNGSRVVLNGTNHIYWENKDFASRDIAEVRIYMHEDQWVAEDSSSDKLLSKPSPRQFEMSFISKEDYERLRWCVVQRRFRWFYELARKILKTLPELANRSLDYDRACAHKLLRCVIRRLKTEQTPDNNVVIFDQLLAYLPSKDDALPYQQLAATTGLSEEALRMRVSRLRKRFRKMLWDEVAQTVMDPADIEDEIRHLMQALLDDPDDKNEPPSSCGGQPPCRVVMDCLARHCGSDR